jgi:hypothetical protein
MIFFFYLLRLFLTHCFLWTLLFFMPCVGVEMLGPKVLSIDLFFQKMSFLFGKFILFSMFFSVFSLFFVLKSRGELFIFLSSRPALKSLIRAVMTCTFLVIFLDVVIVSPYGCHFFNRFLKSQSSVSLGSAQWEIRKYDKGYFVSNKRGPPFHVMDMDHDFGFRSYALGQEKQVRDKDLVLKKAWSWRHRHKKDNHQILRFKDFFKCAPYVYKNDFTRSFLHLVYDFSKGNQDFLMKVQIFFWMSHIVWCGIVPLFVLAFLLQGRDPSNVFIWHRFFLCGSIFLVLFMVREWSVASSFLMQGMQPFFILSFVPVMMLLISSIRLYNQKLMDAL